MKYELNDFFHSPISTKWNMGVIHTIIFRLSQRLRVVIYLHLDNAGEFFDSITLKPKEPVEHFWAFMHHVDRHAVLGLCRASWRQHVVDFASFTSRRTPQTGEGRYGYSFTTVIHSPRYEYYRSTSGPISPRKIRPESNTHRSPVCCQIDHSLWWRKTSLDAISTQRKTVISVDYKDLFVIIQTEYLPRMLETIFSNMELKKVYRKAFRKGNRFAKASLTLSCPVKAGDRPSARELINVRQNRKLYWRSQIPSFANDGELLPLRGRFSKYKNRSPHPDALQFSTDHWSNNMINADFRECGVGGTEFSESPPAQTVIEVRNKWTFLCCHCVRHQLTRDFGDIGSWLLRIKRSLPGTENQRRQKHDGADIVAINKIRSFFHSIFSQINVHINGKLVSVPACTRTKFIPKINWMIQSKKCISWADFILKIRPEKWTVWQAK